LRGVVLCTHVDRVDLDDSRFAPVFLHPQNAGDIRRIESHHRWNVIGFPPETTITATG
jgi:aminocarboxymuconate-semialdehyde decarboxylase